MRIAAIAAAYFAIVFAFGFAFGLVRVLWLEPRVGGLVAELAEAPLMLAVVVLVARGIVRRHPELARSAQWLGVGVAGLVLLLLVEFTVVLGLRRLTFAQYVESRELWSTLLYALLLAAFAAMPLAVFRLRRGGSVASLERAPRGHADA